MMSQKQENKVVPAPFAKRGAPGKAAGAGKVKIPRPKKPRKTKKRKKTPGIISFFLLVALPTVLAGLYYAFIAADQYMVETRFAVRTATTGSSSSLLSTLGLGLGGVSAGDTYMVLEYVQSREILKNINGKLDLKKRFTRPRWDYYAALPKDATFEDFVKYWRSMVEVALDHTSQILSIRVFAFTPEDARDISAAILKESEHMINELSARAREDAVAYAEDEVRKAEERLRAIRARFRKFRSDTQQIDPAKQAQVQVAIIGKLQEQLSHLRAKLGEARSYLSENAPTIVYLKNRIKALAQQVSVEKQKLGNARPPALPRDGARKNEESLSATLSEYEALVVEREFAEKFYLSTLNGLEAARLLANRQQRYLATFVRPYLPDEALYPKRIRNVIFIFLSLTLVWGLGMLMVQSVRDRL